MPWLSLPDAKAHHGRSIDDTEEHTNALGIANSSARLLPAGTVCLSRTASVGYVTVLQRPMATSQDFVNWVCGEGLSPEFLKYLFLAEGREGLLRFASGSVHQTVYYPEAKAFHVCLPGVEEQQRIVAVLDEAFAGIAAARANAERNLRNARALFEGRVEQAFTQNVTWPPVRLGDAAAIQYGYTQSATEEPVGPRFLRITDIRDNGVDWSSVPYCPIDAADRPKFRLSDGDIVFARTGATTGKSFLVTRPPDAVFASYLIRVRLHPTAPLPAFVDLFFQTRTYWNAVRSGTTGSAQGGFNASKLAELIFPAPSTRAEQETVVRELSQMADMVAQLEDVYQRKLAALDELKRSLLHHAFTGQLTTQHPTPTRARTWGRPMSPTDRHAGILAIAYKRHADAGRTATFGHVKAEKIAHLVEAHLGLDLGRTPVKDAAGPNDFACRKQVDQHARRAGQFDFVREDAGNYRFVPLAGFDELVERTRHDLGPLAERVDHLVGLMLPMRTFSAEIFATTYAAWNNLLLDGRPVTDEAIVREAREDWHPDKLRIPHERFVRTIAWMRAHDVTPAGRGKRVTVKPRAGGQESAAGA